MPRFIMRKYLSSKLDIPLSDKAYTLFTKLAKKRKELTKATYLLKCQQKYLEISRNKLYANPGSAKNSWEYRYHLVEITRMEKRIQKTIPKKIDELKADLLTELESAVPDIKKAEAFINTVLEEFYS